MKKYILGFVILIICVSSYNYGHSRPGGGDPGGDPDAQGNVLDAIEFQALKDIYDSLGGPNWTNKSGWPTQGNWPSSATAADMDGWYGIGVTNGDITSIGLGINNLIGKIPTSALSHN